MATKVTKELARIDRPRFISPFKEMERLFEDAWERPFSLMRTVWPELEKREYESMLPLLDVYEEGHELVVKADLPGLKKEEIDINLTDNVLTISGERKVEEKVEKEKYHRYERRYGSFFREIDLPYEIDTEKVNAHFENGVLEIRLMKSHEAESKTRKIQITG